MIRHKLISRNNQALVVMAAVATFIPFPQEAQTSAPAAKSAPSGEAWMNKPIASWTERDAELVLERSPWAKTTVAGIARRQTEDERRAGGNMGQPTGVGYDGVGDKGRPVLPTSLFTGPRTPPPARVQIIRLLVRWESALPVQAAELKRGEASPPTLSDNGYLIAVYGVPFTDANGDPLSLARDFKESAFLKREGKKDVKPLSVEAFELEHNVVVVYRFPLSAEISKKDGAVEFVALIGRLQVSQTFNVEEMQFQGKLEL